MFVSTYLGPFVGPVLSRGWKNNTLSLINDDDYVYREIPHPVNTDYFVFCFDQLQLHYITMVDANAFNLCYIQQKFK